MKSPTINTENNTNIRKKNSVFLKNLISYASEFCCNTSIHGLKFLGESGRSIWEKIWWLVILTISLYYCSEFIMKAYNRWQTTPVIVNFATSQTPIWQIPFPAVTICPEIKAVRSKFNYTEMHTKRQMHTLLSNESDYFEYMSLLCASRRSPKLKFIDEKMLSFLAEVAPHMNDTIWNCKWMGDYMPCSNIFVPVITDVGVCYSFNILDHTELYTEAVYLYKNFGRTNSTTGWSLTTGYFGDTRSYPRRALFAGTRTGLSLNLQTMKVDKDFLCGVGMQGYKVHIHHPADIPSVDHNYFRVSLDEVVIATIKPNVMTTSEELRSYSFHQRQCYFPKEKVLKYFKVYSQENCYAECLTNFTLQICQCVEYYMPRNRTTPICGPASRNCSIFAEVAFLSNQVATKIKRLSSKFKSYNFSEQCICYPSCTFITYDSELSQTFWDWVKYYDSTEFRAEMIKQSTHISKLIIFFKDRQFMTSERSELYGPADCVASFGGIMGLFIGFSFISLAEFIYYLTLRIAFNLKTFGVTFWAGNKHSKE